MMEALNTYLLCCYFYLAQFSPEALDSLKLLTKDVQVSKEI